MGDNADYSLSLDMLHSVNRQEGFLTEVNLNHLRVRKEFFSLKVN